MSMLRKTVITVAITGAGLGSLTGAAFANDSHHSDSHAPQGNSCSNHIKALNETKGGGLADVAGGDQAPIAANVCDLLNNNKLLNKNNVALGGTITNGDTTNGDDDAPVDGGAAGGLGGLGGLLGL